MSVIPPVSRDTYDTMHPTCTLFSAIGKVLEIWIENNQSLQEQLEVRKSIYQQNEGLRVAEIREFEGLLQNLGETVESLEADVLRVEVKVNEAQTSWTQLAARVESVAKSMEEKLTRSCVTQSALKGAYYDLLNKLYAAQLEAVAEIHTPRERLWLLSNCGCPYRHTDLCSPLVSAVRHVLGLQSEETKQWQKTLCRSDPTWDLICKFRSEL